MIREELKERESRKSTYLFDWPCDWLTNQNRGWQGHMVVFKQPKNTGGLRLGRRIGVEFGCLKVVNQMSYLTVGLLENTSRLVDVSLNWTINSTG